MNKGQVSFDLIIAIVFTAIFFSGLFFLADDIVALQTDLAVRAQLKEIALNSSQLISAGQTLNTSDIWAANNTSFSLNYSVPEILVPGEENIEKCIVGIDTAQGTVTVSFRGISETANFVPTTLSVTNNVKCGEILTVSE
ncbi:MAG: hypothetical protein JW772_03815 [Candidatus Diapherotrites archaeon]|nr:hypothetical protein [Candidatus Diapherotrites archaeon]